MPLGMLVFGPLADVIDVRFIMIGTGAVMSLFALYIINNKRLLAFDAKGRPDIKQKPTIINPDTIPENTIKKPD